MNEYRKVKCLERYSYDDAIRDVWLRPRTLRLRNWLDKAKWLEGKHAAIVELYKTAGCRQGPSHHAGPHWRAVVQIFDADWQHLRYVRAWQFGNRWSVDSRRR